MNEVEAGELAGRWAMQASITVFGGKQRLKWRGKVMVLLGNNGGLEFEYEN